MEVSFTPDTQLAVDAAGYAQRAVDLAKRRFQLALDYRERSIAHVETILGQIHGDNLEEKTAFNLGVMFGSYIGEVARRNHGAAWGRIQASDGSEFPGLQLDSGTLFWPWARARNRIMNGPEDNIRHYYDHLMADEE
ncbi:MAG TPA: hypothetical protein VGM39_23880 [Kofleriaceae bacterium]